MYPTPNICKRFSYPPPIIFQKFRTNRPTPPKKKEKHRNTHIPHKKWKPLKWWSEWVLKALKISLVSVRPHSLYRDHLARSIYYGLPEEISPIIFSYDHAILPVRHSGSPYSTATIFVQPRFHVWRSVTSLKSLTKFLL